MKNKKQVTHRFKGLVNPLPTPPNQKILPVYGYISIKMPTLKILESWKIQFTNTLLIALL